MSQNRRTNRNRSVVYLSGKYRSGWDVDVYGPCYKRHAKKVQRRLRRREPIDLSDIE